MIKRTLYFSNPTRLRIKDQQLQIRKEDKTVTIPVEDIGFLILDHYGVTISHAALAELLQNNVAIVTTDMNHMPAGLFLPLAGNTLQNERFRYQLEATQPLKKRLWQQTVKAKIRNQARLLHSLGIPNTFLLNLVKKVRSDDALNMESQAARYYWANLFDPVRFKRHRYGKPPNNLLNYGYAILRSVIARALVGTGLLPGLGIHHRNKYNAYPLADDIMEPYRPFVDEIVWNLAMNEYDISVLRPELKREFLEIPALPVNLRKETMSLMLAASKTTASLQRCFAGESKSMVYPECG